MKPGWKRGSRPAGFPDEEVVQSKRSAHFEVGLSYERSLQSGTGAGGMSQPEPIDLDIALRSTEGSHEVLRELAGVWREHMPATVAGIQRSITDQDGPGLARQAHQLAGA